jgi:hypothetical protein
MDGCAVDVASQHLSLADRHPPRRWANGADKALVAARDRQLLETMRANPTASASVLAAILGVGIGCITSRWQRLAAQGLLVKDKRGIGGRWGWSARLSKVIAVMMMLTML